MKYKIEHLQDNTYQVFEPIGAKLDAILEELVYTDWENIPSFQGSLHDCEAYIRLKEDSGIDF